MGSLTSEVSTHTLRAVLFHGSNNLGVLPPPRPPPRLYRRPEVRMIADVLERARIFLRRVQRDFHGTNRTFGPGQTALILVIELLCALRAAFMIL